MQAEYEQGKACHADAEDDLCSDGSDSEQDDQISVAPFVVESAGLTNSRESLEKELTLQVNLCSEGSDGEPEDAQYSPLDRMNPRRKSFIPTRVHSNVQSPLVRKFGAAQRYQSRH